MTTVPTPLRRRPPRGPGPAPGGAAPRPAAITRAAWAKVATVGLLVLVLFRHALFRLWGQVNPVGGDPDWGHAVYVPLIGLAYLYQRREELFRPPVRPAPLGWLLVIGGVALHAAGIWPVLSDFVQYAGMLVTVCGLVLLLAGWRVARTAWVALALLLLAFPWPPSAYRGASQSLQHVTAVASVWALQLTGINADASGNRIAVYAAAGEVVTLNVAEACSGLRSLITFVTLGVAVALFARRPLWQKGVVVLAAVPVAVLCNVMRVTVMGLLEVNGHAWVHEPSYHALTGLVMLIPGLLMIFGLLRVLDYLVPAAAAAADTRASPPATRADAGAGADGVVVARGRSGRATFVAAVVVLAAAIAALDGAVSAMRLQFVKLPVPLRHPLDALPARLGHWRQVTTDEPLRPDVQAALGTDKYVFRSYVDTRMVPAGVIDELSRRTGAGRADALAGLRAAQPRAVLELGITYQTGRVDRVAHVPDQCYIAGGFQTTDVDAVTWTAAGRTLRARSLRFEIRHPLGRSARRVAYFFNANGRYESDPWAVRRLQLNPFETHAYYAKIELATSLDTPADTRAVMTDFLNAAIPEIEALLPQWRAGSAAARAVPQPAPGS